MCSDTGWHPTQLIEGSEVTQREPVANPGAAYLHHDLSICSSSLTLTHQLSLCVNLLTGWQNECVISSILRTFLMLISILNLADWSHLVQWQICAPVLFFSLDFTMEKFKDLFKLATKYWSLEDVRMRVAVWGPGRCRGVGFWGQNCNGFTDTLQTEEMWVMTPFSKPDYCILA